MTQPLPPSLSPDERELAQRLARIGPHGEPSPAIDARILAAAHAAATGPAATAPLRPFRPRWPLALGMAATVVLAVGIAWQLRPLPAPSQAERVGEAAIASQAAALPAEAPAEAGADASVEPAAPAVDLDAGVATSDAALPPHRADRRIATPERAESPLHTASASEPAAFPPAPPAATTEAAAKTAAAQTAADSNRLQVSEGAAVAPAVRAATPLGGVASGVEAQRAASAVSNQAGSVPPAQAAEAARDEPLDDVPPATADSPMVRDAWLQRIRVLMERGDNAGARASLREFERRYPGFLVPDDLRALQR